MPILAPEAVPGRPANEVFRLTRAARKGALDSPATLTGDLIILEVLAAPAGEPAEHRILLRGQVVPLSAAGDRFLFAVGPVATNMEQLASWRIDMSDLAVGDPTFDFLLMLTSLRRERDRAEADKVRLEWQERIAHLLHRVTLASAHLTDAAPAFELTLAEVCRELHWQFGHAFVVAEDDQETLVSADAWFPPESQRYQPLIERTRAARIPRGIGLPGRAFANARIEWMQDVTQDPEYRRRPAFAGWGPVCGVAVPIIAHGTVVAVLEFYTENPPTQSPALMQFFETVARQVATVMERQLAFRREQEHLAQVTMSARLSSLGEMAAGVGHEINNPLAALLLSAQHLLEMAREGDLDPETFRVGLERIETSGQRITRIVNGLRAFSREGSQDPLDIVAVERIVEDTLALCQARFRHGEVHLEVVPAPSGLTIECRAVELSQVLLNLLNNAFDAVVGTPGAWVRLELDEQGDDLEWRVTDSGHGIPASDLTRIMTPFFTTKPVGKGTGLGLSISARIIDSYRGQLWLDTERPNTCFVVRLPKRQPVMGVPSH